jgi:hypothetical protein
MKFTFDVEIPTADVELVRLYLTRELQKEQSAQEMLTPMVSNTDVERFLAMHVSASLEHFIKEHIPHGRSKKKQTRHKEN